MKKLIVVASFFVCAFAAKSQNLTVEGAAPNLYITHTVAPKENFYSVGRLYNQNPKTIAAFNSLVMEKGLTIGQHIKIPLTEQNLDINGKAEAGETLIPLTHVVAKSETISKIASDNNVSAQSIKQWNRLSSDNIAPGTPLVVGHLKMSSTANVAKTNSNPAATPPPVAQKHEPMAAAKKEEITSSAAQAPVVEKKQSTPAVKEEPARQAETAVATPAKETPLKETPVKDEPLKATQAETDDTRRNETYSYASSAGLGSFEGVFANLYSSDAVQKSVTTKSGEAATFKSTSGWQDKKYYVLMNDVNPGTIIKIASAENKIVYAKVLGSMPDMKENNGLLIRISNAAASYLGIIDPKFPVQISYYQ